MKVLAIGETHAVSEGVRQMLARGSPASTVQAIEGDALEQAAIDDDTELVLVVPEFWQSLHAWLPRLRQRVGALPWLVMADLPLAGLFFPPHETHLCGFISRHAADAELADAAEALLQGHPRFHPLAMLELLLDQAPRRTPGMQIKAPTDVEFQCGCGIALGLSNARIAGVRDVSLSTVKAQVSALLRKLNYGGRQEVGRLFNQALVYPSTYPGGRTT